MTNPRELAVNASRWGSAMKKDIPRDIGWIILFFPKDAIAQAKGVYVANVNERAVKDEVAAIVKRWSDQPRIILPGGD